MSINWIAVGSIATIIVAAATFVTAWITSQTIKEMKKQREASYQPTLLPNEIELSFSCPKRNDDTPLEFCLHNIGLGAAKNIIIDMSVPNWENFFMKLQGFIDNKTQEIKVEKILDGFIVRTGLKSEHVSSFTHFKEDYFSLIENKKYILAGESAFINFPKGYTQCFDLLAKTIGGIGASDPRDLTDSFYLNIKIAYEDIAGKPKKEHFRFIILEYRIINIQNERTLVIKFVPLDDVI